MIGYFANPDFFKNYKNLYNEFDNAIKSLYIEVDSTIDKCVPSIYDKLITIDKNNHEELLKIVKQFIVNYYKIKNKY